MAVRFNPFTGGLDYSPSASLTISEDGTLSNGNEVAQIQSGELTNVAEIDAGEYSSSPE
jgi:hypothetical protein